MSRERKSPQRPPPIKRREKTPHPRERENSSYIHATLPLKGKVLGLQVIF